MNNRIGCRGAWAGLLAVGLLACGSNTADTSHPGTGGSSGTGGAGGASGGGTGGAGTGGTTGSGGAAGTGGSSGTGGSAGGGPVQSGCNATDMTGIAHPFGAHSFSYAAGSILPTG